MNDNLIEIIYGERKEYEGLKEVKRLLNEDDNFKNIIIEGIKENKISAFPENLWEKIEAQNIRGIKSFTDVFSRGLNIDNCTIASKQLSYSFDTCYVAGGTLKPIIDSPFARAKDGRHTWLLYEDKVYDTTFMLVIENEYAEKLGYITENKYNPNTDPIYSSAKYFTNDRTIKKAK